MVSVAKVAIPFAVLGALFLYFQIEGGTADLYGKLPLATDAAAIERRYYTTIGLLYAVVITMIAAPIVEEIVFRGFLYGAWEREWGWIRAMLATSLCFALAHPGAMIRTFLGSVVFVCLLRRTGSLWSPICAHMIYNTLVTWPLLGHVIVVRSHDGIERAESWILEFVCLAFVVVALPIYVWIARTKRTPEAP
ncbi:hypothetical protein DSM104440_03424 [Usitatibacter palustris]|uniref:CAAX prenyl protease 2/Lysostaphin resistance protein A-like domain-containing protein n=1 Tax=Usitatibacter palustris TaxID=2732487 RepID=A0A6M4H9Y4_9PROT|nr:hypothetical protein DSM104440_03424 [Usitatibacter palustris]